MFVAGRESLSALNWAMSCRMGASRQLVIDAFSFAATSSTIATAAAVLITWAIDRGSVPPPPVTAAVLAAAANWALISWLIRIV